MKHKKTGISKEAQDIFVEIVSNTQPIDKDRAVLKKQRRKTKDVVKTVDLHGFTLNEAIARVEREIKIARVNAVPYIRFVTGVGKHSDGISPVLFNGVSDFILEMGLDSEKEIGSLLVCLKK